MFFSHRGSREVGQLCWLASSLLQRHPSHSRFPPGCAHTAAASVLQWHHPPGTKHSQTHVSVPPHLVQVKIVRFADSAWGNSILHPLLQPYPLIPLSLCEVGGEPQFGNKGEGFTDGEVGKKTVILADVSDALFHQLGCVGPPVNQNLTGRHCTSFITACYYVQQRCFTTTWIGRKKKKCEAQTCTECLLLRKLTCSSKCIISKSDFEEVQKLSSIP